MVDAGVFAERQRTSPQSAPAEMYVRKRVQREPQTGGCLVVREPHEANDN
jgi:hypothetical protein